MVLSPGGAAVNSQGRKPLEGGSKPRAGAGPIGRFMSPAGAAEPPDRRGSTAPPGLNALGARHTPPLQGLTPLAIDCRPSGAQNHPPDTASAARPITGSRPA